MKDTIRGAMAKAPPELQERIKNIAGAFHYRDAAPNADGSMGTVRLGGLHELQDALAHAAAVGAEYASAQANARIAALEEEIYSWASHK